MYYRCIGLYSIRVVSSSDFIVGFITEFPVARAVARLWKVLIPGYGVTIICSGVRRSILGRIISSRGELSGFSKILLGGLSRWNPYN